jgi:hypothetical protein
MDSSSVCGLHTTLIKVASTESLLPLLHCRVQETVHFTLRYE